MTERITTRLVLLPGLGADARLFDAQRERFANIEVPPWLPNRDGETLADYAARMARTVDSSQPFYLGGVSFGGMVAQEMARHLPAAGVFMIATCRSGRCIAPHLRYFAQFSRILPRRTFEVGQCLSSLFVKKFGDLSEDQRHDFESMLDGVCPDFVRWGIIAITAWPGDVPLSMPVHHIHGADDQLIPVKNVQPDEIVPGGGHLINVTHADAVNRFIANRLT